MKRLVLATLPAIALASPAFAQLFNSDLGTGIPNALPYVEQAAPDVSAHAGSCRYEIERLASVEREKDQVPATFDSMLAHARELDGAGRSAECMLVVAVAWRRLVSE